MLSMGDVARNLHQSCTIDENSTGPRPADPQEVALIVAQLDLVTRPALNRANEARNRLIAAQKKVFAHDPDAADAAKHVAALGDVLSAYGRVMLLIDSDGDLYAACSTYPAYRAAEDSLLGHEIEFVTINTQYQPLYTQIQQDFTRAMGTCKAVRVREPIPVNRINKAGPVKTSRSGGAALVYPKSIDVTKKPVRLPVNVKPAAADYGIISVTTGSKALVATRGGFTDQEFGLFMTIPAKTAPGVATITFRADAGPTVKARIRMR